MVLLIKSFDFFDSPNYPCLLKASKVWQSNQNWDKKPHNHNKTLVRQLNRKLRYSLFHKTLPKSSLKRHCISVRFYEMGDIPRKT